MPTKKKANPKRKGVPSEFSQSIADKLCHTIQESTLSLRKACNVIGFDFSTVKRWLEKYPDFRAQYQASKAIQADELLDEVLEIADDTSQDEIFIESEDKDGKGAKRVPNNEFIQRSKLRVETRLKIAALIAPKKYGAKTEVIQHNTGEMTIRFVDEDGDSRNDG
jgi:hypothetical protein